MHASHTLLLVIPIAIFPAALQYGKVAKESVTADGFCLYSTIHIYHLRGGFHTL